VMPSLFKIYVTVLLIGSIAGFIVKIIAGV